MNYQYPPCSVILVFRENRNAFQRGSNWNNTGDAGVFALNLNNAPTNTNNNIGFRCASDQNTPGWSGICLRIYAQCPKITRFFLVPTLRRDKHKACILILVINPRDKVNRYDLCTRKFIISKTYYPPIRLPENVSGIKETLLIMAFFWKVIFLNYGRN